jgi:CDP-diacylglycerol--glycerol-3-phosphate 3-phosphatidyltransferase
MIREDDPRFALPVVLDIARQGRFLPHALFKAVAVGIAHSHRYSRMAPQSLKRSYSITVAVLLVVVFGELLALWLVADAVDVLFPSVVSLTWFAVASALVRTQLTLVRRPSGEFYSSFGVPNALTLFRLLNIPLLVALTPSFPDHRGLLAAGSVLFVLVALSDFGDGFLARSGNRVSEFGRIYDPLCDIAFNAGVCVALYLADYLPAWYLVLALARFLLPIIGGAWVYVFRRPWRITPTFWGKATVAIHAATVALIMIRELAASPFLFPLSERFILLSGILLAFNLLVIVERGLSLME